MHKLIVSVSLGASVLFKWRGRSCLDSGERSCWLDHGDSLVMDGQCQDEFLHSTDPGLEQERINVTFWWIKQHASSCPLFRTGVACCLPTCAKGFSVLVMENSANGVFLAFWLLFCVLCVWEVLVLLVPLLWLLWCASRWTRPLGGGRLGHYLYNLWGRHFTIQKNECMFFRN